MWPFQLFLMTIFTIQNGTINYTIKTNLIPPTLMQVIIPSSNYTSNHKQTVVFLYKVSYST